MNPGTITSTEYIGGIYEVTNTGAVTKYYQAGGRSIAMRDGGGALNYLLADALGSTATMTDSSGGNAVSIKYWPFGNMRSAAVPGTDKLYTGQQQEPGTSSSVLGLYNYGARFYSATLGKFLSVDPIVGSTRDPQSWNPYAYVRNNPMRFIDPTGLDRVCLFVCSGSADQIMVEDGRCHTCEALVALANAGYHSAAEVYAQQQLVGALEFLQAMQDAATRAQFIAYVTGNPSALVTALPGGGCGCDAPTANEAAMGAAAAAFVAGSKVCGACGPIAAAATIDAIIVYEVWGDDITTFFAGGEPDPETASLRKQLHGGGGPWEEVSRHEEPARAKAYKGGTSVDTIYRNKVTGATRLVHDLLDRDGKSHGHESIKPVPDPSEPEPEPLPLPD